MVSQKIYGFSILPNLFLLLPLRESKSRIKKRTGGVPKLSELRNKLYKLRPGKCGEETEVQNEEFKCYSHPEMTYWM
jgi:hypothetical protein